MAGTGLALIISDIEFYLALLLNNPINTKVSVISLAKYIACA